MARPMSSRSSPKILLMTSTSLSFPAGGSISKKYGPIASEKGCFVVDNSSAFRMTEGVPLVIPRSTPRLWPATSSVARRKVESSANPNCSTIIALMAVTPIHRAVGVERMIASTYQAASGAGALAMAELEQQTRDVLNGDPVTMDIFSWQYAFNLFSHNAPMTENGYNEEEMKMVKETKKIWGTDDVSIAATCLSCSSDARARGVYQPHPGQGAR